MKANIYYFHWTIGFKYVFWTGMNTPQGRNRHAIIFENIKVRPPSFKGEGNTEVEVLLC